MIACSDTQTIPPYEYNNTTYYTNSFGTADNTTYTLTWDNTYYIDSSLNQQDPAEEPLVIKKNIFERKDFIIPNLNKRSVPYKKVHNRFGRIFAI